MHTRAVEAAYIPIPSKLSALNEEKEASRSTYRMEKMRHIFMDEILILSMIALTGAVLPIPEIVTPDGVESVNGSNASMECNSHNCLFDGYSPLVNASAPNWASGLVTLRKQIASDAISFPHVILTFDFKRDVSLTAIEVDVFICPNWNIDVPFITVYGSALRDFNHDQSDFFAHYNPRERERLCGCVSNISIPFQPGEPAYSIWHIVVSFGGHANTEWVHVGEVRFLDTEKDELTPSVNCITPQLYYPADQPDVTTSTSPSTSSMHTPINPPNKAISATPVVVTASSPNIVITQSSSHLTTTSSSDPIPTTVVTSSKNSNPIPTAMVRSTSVSGSILATVISSSQLRSPIQTPLVSSTSGINFITTTSTTVVTSSQHPTPTSRPSNGGPITSTTPTISLSVSSSQTSSPLPTLLSSDSSPMTAAPPTVMATLSQIDIPIPTTSSSGSDPITTTSTTMRTTSQEDNSPTSTPLVSESDLAPTTMLSPTSTIPPLPASESGHVPPTPTIVVTSSLKDDPIPTIPSSLSSDSGTNPTTIASSSQNSDSITTVSSQSVTSIQSSSQNIRQPTNTKSPANLFPNTTPAKSTPLPPNSVPSSTYISITRVRTSSISTHSSTDPSTTPTVSSSEPSVYTTSNTLQIQPDHSTSTVYYSTHILQDSNTMTPLHTPSSDTEPTVEIDGVEPGVFNVQAENQKSVNDKNGPPLLIIIVIVVLIALCLFVLIAILFIAAGFRRREHISMQEAQINGGDNQLTVYNPLYVCASVLTEGVYSDSINQSDFAQGSTWDPSVVTAPQLLTPVFTDPTVLPQDTQPPFEVTASNVSEIKGLGISRFGEVVLANTKGLSLKERQLTTAEDEEETPVLIAAKKAKPTLSQTDKEAFDTEVKFLLHLKHTNILQILGICNQDPPFIVMEYMEEGDLNQFLQKYQEIAVHPSNETQIAISSLLYMSSQIAKAMVYLNAAAFDYIHRDLATRNCLVGKNFTVKVTDLSVNGDLYRSHYYCICDNRLMPIRWMATECFDGKFSEKSDVWAFGVTMWELFTLAKDVPYPHLSDEEVVQNALTKENLQLPSRPEVCPQSAYEIMKQCWIIDLQHRATFREVNVMLQTCM